jgi:hypothetical protein
VRRSNLLAALRYFNDNLPKQAIKEGRAMRPTWNTKYGPRRVRHDPPTLDEAIFAARGLTDDTEEQVAIAAGLMEVAPEEVRTALKKSPPPRKPTATVAFTSRGGTHRSVVVERKTPRRPANRPLGGRSFV